MTPPPPHHEPLDNDGQGRFVEMLQEKAVTVIASLLTAAIIAVAGLFMTVNAMRGDIRQMNYRLDVTSQNRYTSIDAARDFRAVDVELESLRRDIQRLEAQPR